MRHSFLIASGLLLITVGVVIAVFNLIAQWAGLEHSLWRLWPMSTATFGLLCLIPPLFAGQRHGLAGLYLLALPLLTLSTLGVLAQILPASVVWVRLWPTLVLSLALAFGLAGWAWRLVWLGIPAAIVGALGLSLLLTSLSGAWWLWAGLWATLPAAAGLALLAIGARRRSAGLVRAGLVVGTASTGLGLGLIVLVLGQGLAAGLVLGGTLAILGTLMVVWSVRRTASPAAGTAP